MGLLSEVEKLWKSALLTGSAFSGRYNKLRWLYSSLEDPWEMASEREQHRFAETSAQLRTLAPRFDGILELGCGEGHQSLHLSALTDRLCGVELSAKAVDRARKRCPGAEFVVAGLDQASNLFPNVSFDLITACEVLYYTPDPGAVLPALQQRARYLYVSNYLPRSEQMREHFSGPGWRSLPDISHGDTTWECFVWEAAAAGR